ncbi:acid protease [Viridothelium virens]|uniref:Acid protease n=1 Tax=Viridothelium virens TaxID=1048519 RepID=A0A6A6H4E7_VIRVR|nr:acid protease [Viridothelium virens]
MRSGKQENGAYAVGTAPLQSIEGGTEYDVQIQFADTTPVTVILDTGSSDTWLAQSSFQCVDETGADQPQSTCNFGPLFNGTFDNGQIANENFNISYGDGETLTGVLGYEDVTIAGIKVTNQEVALVNYAFWEGDGISSGLIGLAYPALTSAYAGDNPAADVPGDTVEYNSIFTTAINESLVAPMFSLALERAPSSGGYIAFGGLPPVSVDNSSFVSTPIEVLEIVDDPQTTSQYSFYTITPDGFTITPAAASRRSFRNGRQGIDVTSDFPTIVDSGTTLVYLPDELAIDINEAFEPSAEYVEDEGAFFVDCQATAPTFGVNINGTTFNVNPVDLIFQSEVDPTTGLCLTGIQAGGEGPFILGDVFLQNVVAVFDVGAAELRFAPHEDY